MPIQLVCGDCLCEMPKLAAGTVDLVLSDLPYGVTENKTDICLPLDRLWFEWKRLLKPGGVVVLTSQFPYTIDLIQSNRDWFRYDLVWDKCLSTGFLNANRMPLRVHEHILIFSEKQARYYPQKHVGPRTHTRRSQIVCSNNNYGEYSRNPQIQYSCLKYPNSIIRIPKLHASVTLHPTEKPAALAEYLIKTFTQEGDVVLDCCFGVGWTALASKKTRRNYVGIEIDPSNVAVAKNRLSEVSLEITGFLNVNVKVTDLNSKNDRC